MVAGAIQLRRMDSDVLRGVAQPGGQPLRAVLVNCQLNPRENGDICDL